MDFAITNSPVATAPIASTTRSAAAPGRTWIRRFMDWFDSGAITSPTTPGHNSKIILLQGQVVAVTSGTMDKSPIDLAR